MAKALTFEELFDPDFLTALQSFGLRLRQVGRGGRYADQKSPATGQGLEFVDFKPYVPGDDLRSIDWNIYRRLGRIFVKVFEERQDLPVYFLIDVSKSMFFESQPRIGAGMRTGLALASIALAQHDNISLFPFSGTLAVKARSMSGKRSVIRVAKHLAELGEQSDTNLASAVRELANYQLRPGLLVIVSDFFDPAGLEDVIAALRLIRHRLLMVQLVRKSDADPSLLPDLQGDVRLVDCESGDVTDVTVTAPMLARYKEVYAGFNDGLVEFARSADAGFVRIDAEEDVLDQLSGLFATGSLVL